MRLLNWFRRGRLESDFDREYRYHFDRRTADLMREGLPESEARRRVTLELGGAAQVREEVRDVWLIRWLRDFLYDLRFSARALLGDRSFTVTAVLSLALGIGATTAIYSLVDQVLLHSLPVRDPARLVLIDWKGLQATVNAFGSSNLMSYPLCRDLQQQDRFFDGVFCRALTTISLSTGGEYTPAEAEIVSGSYFPVLGVRPAIGRLITNDDDGAPGANPVVVLSYDYWKSQYGGAAGIVGRNVLVNRQPMTVIGVAAEGFRGIDVGDVPVLWIPASMSAQAIPGFDNVTNRFVRWVQILGRLRADVTLAQAQAGLRPWFKAVLEDDTRQAGFPGISAEERRRFLASNLVLTPAGQGHSYFRRRITEPLLVLYAATLVLLGLACMNVAGLFLARGSARERELRTRLALGASRGRIGRQLLADSFLIALAGGLLGVALAPVTTHTLMAFLPAGTAGTAIHATLDARLLLFALALSLSAGLLTGFVPALQAARGSLISSLRERSGAIFSAQRPAHGRALTFFANSSPRRAALCAGLVKSGLPTRRALMTGQIAFTLVLVIAAALFVRTLSELMAKGPGFDTASLISFGVDPMRDGYTKPQTIQLVRRIHDELRASPATQSAAVVFSQLLTGGSWNNKMTIQADRRMVTDREMRLNAVSPDFFTTLGARILAGRDFDDHDTLPLSQGGQRVAIVNQAFVDRYFGGRSPLRARLGPGTAPDAKAIFEIVGVVSNISYRDMREQSEQAFFPMIEDQGGNFWGSNFYVRIHGSPEAAAQSIRAIVHAADPTLPIAYLRTVDEQVSRSLSTERMLAALSGSFGGLALLLSLVGLYGVMSFVVTQRTREIGVRVALGASRSATLWLVLRDALSMTATGIAIALRCTWALGRLIESQLYDVRPTDPATIAAAVLILSATALASALIPARRACALSPTEALRLE